MTNSPADLAAHTPALFACFREHNFTTGGIADYLGTAGTAAWHRGEPGAVRRLCDDSPLGILIKAFLLKDPVDPTRLAELVGAEILSVLLDSAHRVAFDIIPHAVSGQNRWVCSDIDASMIKHVPGPDHVLGVGAASLSLLSSVPTNPVESLLDVGTGSGIQLLAQLGVAQRLTGTDVHPRALDFARATLAEHPDVELLAGSWFEPVKGRRFDRIVANPPFVVGLPEVGHVYRDSGLNLDGASELVVSSLADHLTEGGTAHVLAAWVHTADDRWQRRVASWLPDTGVSAWIIQRDLVDPEMYVGTWLRDESIDPRSPEAAERTKVWLDHFAAHGVTGIGFGFVAVQRIADDCPSDIVAEELSHDFSDPLHEEVAEHFLRTEWLRGASPADILGARYLLRPTVATETVSVADLETGMGFAPELTRIVRMDGPRWSHEIDEHLLRIISGLHPSGLPLAEAISLYCLANGLEEDANRDIVPAVLGACIDLIRHGFLIPTELLEKEH